MDRIARVAMLALFLGVIASCGGGGSGGGGSSSYALSGRVQKGPFGIGSQISINALNSSLSPTGSVYSTQTSDALGDFSVPSGVSSSMVEIVAQGFYLDELSGNLSASQITLRSVSDLSSNSAPTVNILTTLQEQRLKSLVNAGASFSSANSQSESEVLALFEIQSSSISGLSSLDSMRVDGTSQEDGVLLAISVILSQIATDRAQSNGTTQAAELSNLVNTISAGLANTGTYTDSTFISQRNKADTEIVPSLIASNLQSYYSKNGDSITTPNFVEWIDENQSGVLPQQQSNEYVYLSNAGSNSIYEYQLNKASGILVYFGSIATGNNPQGIVATHNGKYLYASNSSDGSISEYSIDPTSRSLTEIGTIHAGTFTGIPAVDPTDSYLYVPDQSASSVLEFSINSATGGLSSIGSIGAGSGPWSITVDPSGKYAYVPVGTSVLPYSINSTSGALTALSSVTTGSGAVFIAFTPDEKYAYDSNSNAGNLSGFSVNTSTGNLTSLGSTTTTGTNPYTLAIDPTGKYLYVANVASKEVLGFGINDASGALSANGSVTGLDHGVEAVAVDLTGKFVIAGILGATSGHIASYGINSTTGALTAIDSKVSGNGPVSIAIVD